MAKWKDIEPEIAERRCKILERKIFDLENIISNTSEIIKGDSKDFAARLSVIGLNQKKSELESELGMILAHRVSESMKVSLDGRFFREHTASLGPLSYVLHGLQSIFTSIAQSITIGPTSRGKVSEGIELLTQMRLVATFPSSFGIELEIDSNPDMLGESVAINAMRGLFQSINSFEKKQDLISSAGGLSQRTLSHYRKFFKRLVKYEIEPKIIWKTPAGENFSWVGNLSTINQISINLDSIHRRTEKIVHLSGFLVGASLIKNRFEFITESNELISGTVSKEAKENITSLFGKSCNAAFQLVQIFDDYSDTEKSMYTLIHLSSK